MWNSEEYSVLLICWETILHGVNTCFVTVFFKLPFKIFMWETKAEEKNIKFPVCRAKSLEKESISLMVKG